MYNFKDQLTREQNFEVNQKFFKFIIEEELWDEDLELLRRDRIKHKNNRIQRRKHNGFNKTD